MLYSSLFKVKTQKQQNKKANTKIIARAGKASDVLPLGQQVN